MKAKLTQAEFDLLDTAGKASYEKAGDVYYFTGEIPDVKGLQTALETERGRASNAESAMAAFKGVDPNKYKELLQLEEQTKIDRLSNPAGVAAQLTEMQADFDKKLSAERERADKLTIDRTLESALLKAGVLPGALQDAMDAVRKRVKPIGNDPARLGVLAEDGATMTATSFDKFVAEEFKQLKPWFYADSGAGGTGASPLNRNTQGVATIKVDREASKADPSLYRQAKEQADKTGATIDLGHAPA